MRLKKILPWALLAAAVLFAMVALLQRMAAQPFPVAATTFGTRPAEFKLIAWNVESDGSDPATIAAELSELPADIYCLSEVLPTEFERFARGWPEIHSESGGSDRLQIIYNPERFRLVRRIELHDLNDGRHRSPLVAHLNERATGSEFLVVCVHLARGSEDVRLMQARGLVVWARKQAYPLIAAGDFNFDFDFHRENGNEAFKAFIRDDVWKWIRSKTLVDTNWSDPDRDGKDNFPDSMLDFAFVAGPAKEWDAVCETIVRPGDFPDGDKRSDHRPIQLSVGSK